MASDLNYRVLIAQMLNAFYLLLLSFSHDNEVLNLIETNI